MTQMKNNSGIKFFWAGLAFLNLTLLFLTILFQELSYYGAMAINHEEQIQSILHGLKMLAIGLCISLFITTTINYFAIKDRYILFRKKVIIICCGHIVVNLAYATHLILETLNSTY